MVNGNKARVFIDLAPAGGGRSYIVHMYPNGVQNYEIFEHESTKEQREVGMIPKKKKREVVDLTILNNDDEPVSNKRQREEEEEPSAHCVFYFDAEIMEHADGVVDQEPYMVHDKWIREINEEFTF
jgi:hypothetical protein